MVQFNMQWQRFIYGVCFLVMIIKDAISGPIYAYTLEHNNSEAKAWKHQAYTDIEDAAAFYAPFHQQKYLSLLYMELQIQMRS